MERPRASPSPWRRMVRTWEAAGALAKTPAAEEAPAPPLSWTRPVLSLSLSVGIRKMELLRASPSRGWQEARVR